MLIKATPPDLSRIASSTDSAVTTKRENLQIVFHGAALRFCLLMKEIIFLGISAVANQGKRRRAGSGDRSVPKTTEKPNRWVGGKPDRMNIPKPAQTTLMEYKMGFHSLEQTPAQASQESMLPAGCRRTQISMWIMASMPIPMAILGPGAETMSMGTRKRPRMPSIRIGI